MQLKQKITSTLLKVIRLPVWIKIPIAATLLTFIIGLALYSQDKSAVFAYGGENCVQQLTILPSYSQILNSDSDFDYSYKDFFQLGNWQLLSTSTCFTAKKAPSVGYSQVSISLFGSWFAKKTYIIKVPQPPVVKAEVLSKPVSISKPLLMPISANDSVFDYQLRSGDNVAKCTVVVQVVQCDVESLNLLQGQSYDIKLVRLFNDKVVSTLLDKNIYTISATKVTGASLSDGQIVYDHLKTFSFDFDKTIVKGDIALEKIESTGRKPVASTVTYNDKQLVVNINDDLERSANYEFTISNLQATDESTLQVPYKLDFSVSGGPSVTSVNVGSYNLPLTKTIILSFDQALANNQDVNQFVSVSSTISTTVSRLNNQIYISYSGAPMCSDINIKINAGLNSVYGVTQTKDWSLTTRTTCHSATIIGHSVQGRPIIAYTFGGGAQTILYTGSIHGNEISTKYLMDEWVNELELNARDIPANKTIVVVPTLNPDGNAADTRNNANNVDLNRNFPSADWQTDIYSPANQLVVGGGGPNPFSEPESQVIAAFTIQLQPRLTLSFHSSASYAIGNQAGDSAALAAVYANLSGYADMTGVEGAFSYPITGTYDDWMREVYSLTSVLVELSSNTSSQFAKNKAALWAMANS